MSNFLENHIFVVQISLFLLILKSLVNREFLYQKQNSVRQKILHTLLNAQFLMFVIPVQMSLSVIALFVSRETEINSGAF